eukprot:CAMPEP_0178571864 /NCGR_PEP_ID=MMETSP0697-20121206/17899_1 /TAXON_ID=265572 /ORGANISM="Extubocellulus spinifer, Strain CCMP396" /LENGTH=125 /DNA_ID=CAMNT_0020206519 /DNA_START=347 /DNA_END=725 /DNA_ORIENTATION=+
MTTSTAVTVVVGEAATADSSSCRWQRPADCPRRAAVSAIIIGIGTGCPFPPFDLPVHAPYRHGRVRHRDEHQHRREHERPSCVMVVSLLLAAAPTVTHPIVEQLGFRGGIHHHHQQQQHGSNIDF